MTYSQATQNVTAVVKNVFESKKLISVNETKYFLEMRGNVFWLPKDQIHNIIIQYEFSSIF